MRNVLCCLILLLAHAAWPVRLIAAAPSEYYQKLLEGKYKEVTDAVEEAARRYEYGEDWPLLQVRVYMETGRYPDAMRAVATALGRYPNSLKLRVEAFEVYRQNGDLNRARWFLDEIVAMTGRRGLNLKDASNIVALGRAALWLENDPKSVLHDFYDRARKMDPKLRDVYLAAGELAIEKGDFELAAKEFSEGLKNNPADPDLFAGLARAYSPNDRKEMMSALQEALSINPSHVPSHLLMANHLIDAEQYDEAFKILDQVREVNPNHPEALALRSVIHQVRGESAQAAAMRKEALKFWASNPLVDHVIGKKLSQKYHFAEGAAAQREALRFDPAYNAAKVQLAQDLLRLGEEPEGWSLAESAHEKDEYNLEAYNLVLLHDRLKEFVSITNRNFIVRMDKSEAPIYGDRLLQLLQRAMDQVGPKYGWTPARPTLVEVFPNQGDFAIRTFGMPGGEGFLGVCFGSVITANSPGSPASQMSNWEAVFWHEFCHIITLQLTRNKMPRWLSEGISVYEERQANSAWGQELTPEYRRMIRDGDLTPVGQLSAAFLSPKSEHHLQFAYFESALVVEYVVKTYGSEALRKILADLGNGVAINQALENHTVKLAELEKAFDGFVREQLKQAAPGLDWTEPEEGKGIDQNWVQSHPTNFYALNWTASRAIEQGKWEEAEAPLKQLIELFPNQRDKGNAYERLAQVYRRLNQPDRERELIQRWVQFDADATEAFSRMMELESAAGHWDQVLRGAQLYLAVNPMLPQPYRYLGESAEKTGKPEEAIGSYRTLLKLNPPNAAQIHYRLGRLLYEGRKPGALREVLLALEEAPRFREAQKLLLQISDGEKKKVF